MRRLFVPGYYSGFSNNKMSLDIAIVLAHLTGRTLVPYRFRMPRRAPVDAHPDCAVEPMLVPDLFDIPVRYSNEYLFKTWIFVPGARQCVWAPVVESVLSFPATLPTDNVRFQRFRNGRPRVYALSAKEEDTPDLHIHTQALGHYSYVFYLDDARRRQVVDLMKRVRPKRPYLSVADRIAASIGSFNAIHVRRGDFLRNELTKHKITRTTSVSGEEIVANLASRMHRDDPLVICTDGASSEEIFGPIRQYFRETIFLDRYLCESASIRELIAQLPRNDESVMALLTQLVASKARVFAGTLFSTFTALIHRLRGFDSQESRFLYCHNDFSSPLVRFERCEFLPVDDGPYTWNRIRYPVSPDAYSWMREWPESSDSAPPPFEGEVSPAGTLDFQASEATMHGSTIRCLKEDGSPPLIVDWTDQDAFVTWDVVLTAGGTYSAEIRYACNKDSSGSRYGVGICGGDELPGQVWNTGGWQSLSPWLRLGRLRVPAGRSRLIVRAIEKDVNTIMNLFGIRLVPMEFDRLRDRYDVTSDSMEEVAFSCYGVEIRLVDAAGTDICRDLRDALPPEFSVHCPSGSTVVSYVVTAEILPGTADQPGYLIARDGIDLCAKQTEEAAFQWLCQDIESTVAQRSRQVLFLHAGVVGWRGRAIVIPGRSHAGKSTLVAELVRRGAVYYSDEFAVLDETGRVHPYRRTPVLRDDARRPQDLRLVREDEPTEPLPIGLIVEGAYRPGVTWHPTVVRGAQAVLPLIDATILAHQESARMLRIAARVAPTAVTLRGLRSEAKEVAAQLLDLVDDALVSRAFGADEKGSSDLTIDLSRVADLRLRSRIGRPAPTERRLLVARYMRMTDVLSPAEHQHLLEHALACQAEFQESGVTGRHGENTLNYDVRRSRTLSGARVEEIWNMFDRRLRAILPGVRKELGMAWFHLGEVERQLTAHGSGGFFAPHVDTGHPITASRRISCVYYFYASPRRFTGGELRVYDTWVTPSGSTAAATYTTLTPVDNSIVFFPSDMFHEVCPVRCETDAFAGSRFTMTIWFREGPRPTPVDASKAPASPADSCWLPAGGVGV